MAPPEVAAADALAAPLAAAPEAEPPAAAADDMPVGIALADMPDMVDMDADVDVLLDPVATMFMPVTDEISHKSQGSKMRL